jgi:hypothetical protein
MYRNIVIYLASFENIQKDSWSSINVTTNVLRTLFTTALNLMTLVFHLFLVAARKIGCSYYSSTELRPQIDRGNLFLSPSAKSSSTRVLNKISI